MCWNRALLKGVFCDYAQQSYESAGIKISSHITQGNRYIKQALTMSGLIAAHSKDPAFSSFYNRISQRGSKMKAIIACAHKILILFENLFKLRQRRLAVYMLLTSSVSSATSKQCFELTSSVLSTTSKQCFEQPAASFLLCSLIFIEYQNHFSTKQTYQKEKALGLRKQF